MEDTLFRIPREWLEQSEAFAALYLLSAQTERESDSSDVDSQADEDGYARVDIDHQHEQPIPLDESATSSAFEAFLSVLIPT